MSGSESGAAEAFQLTGRSVGRVWAAVAGVSLLLGSMVGVGFAIDLSLRNGQELGRKTLILASYLSGLYTVLNLAGLGAAALALIAVGRRPGARVFLALGVGFYVLLNGALRFSPTTLGRSPPDPARKRRPAGCRVRRTGVQPRRPGPEALAFGAELRRRRRSSRGSERGEHPQRYPLASRPG